MGVDNMKNKELMEVLSKIPDDAKIYVESDHGQKSESAYYIFVSKSPNLWLYGDDVDWHNINSVGCDFLSQVRAVLIA